MEDKNLQDKINKSYEVKTSKNKKNNNNKIILIVIIVILMIIFFILNNQKSLNKNYKTNENSSNSSENVTAIDENGKETKYKIQDSVKDEKKSKRNKSSNSKKGTSGLIKQESKNRPKVLNKDYKNSIPKKDIDLGNGIIIKNPRQAIDTEDEASVINDNISKSRNKYYDVNTNLNKSLQSYFKSEDDGYIDTKYQDDKDNYVSITAESAEDFISHEIEKKINPSYSGKKGKKYDIKEINIDKYALSQENGFIKNYYTVTYLAKDRNNKELRDSFDFTTTINGGIIWKEREEK